MMLQRLFDWLVPIAEEVRKSEERRNQESRQRQRSFNARSSGYRSKDTYDTPDGYRTANAVNKQRQLEDRDPIDKSKTVLEAWEEAQREINQEDWGDLFKDFDKENYDRRIARIENQLKPLADKHPDYPDWEAINKTPARGFTQTSNGRTSYPQMTLLRAAELPVEIPVEQPIGETEPSKESLKEQPINESALPIDWDAVNQASRNVTTAEEAEANAYLALSVEKGDLADYWFQFASELSNKENEDDDPNE